MNTVELKGKIKRAYQAGVKNGFFTLMTGTGVAQILPILFLPVLTRVYSPSDFGVVAVYLSVVGILSVCASLRYEIAITQPKNDLDSLSILYICIVSAVGFVSLMLLVLLMYSQYVIEFLGLEQLGVWVYFLPLSVLVAAILQALNYWAIRKEKYKSISYSSITQSGITPSAQVLTSYNGFTAPQVNLVLGGVIGQCAAALLLFHNVFPTFKSSAPTINRIKRNFFMYKEFPLFSLPNAMIGTLALQIPVLFLTKIFEVSVVGAFSLVIRILSIPSSLISSVLSNLLLKKFSEASYTGERISKKFLTKVVVSLTVLMIPYILIIYCFGEEIFIIVFGDEWRVAGEMASILIFSIAIRFVVSPLSALLALRQHVKKGMLWQFSYLFFMLAIFYVLRDAGVMQVVCAFVAYEVVIYSVYLFIIFYACEQTNRNVD